MAPTLSPNAHELHSCPTQEQLDESNQPIPTYFLYADPGKMLTPRG
jgi:hypothetical protein